MPILLSTFAIMIDWNIIFSQIATVAFDIIYFEPLSVRLSL